MSIQPEPALAAAVIETAFQDAFKLEGRARERDEAQHFLLDRSGQWAESRRSWLGLVGSDPEAIEEEAKRRFERWKQDRARAAA